MVGIIAVILYREKPRHFASATSALHRASFKHSISLLKENRSVIVAVLSIALLSPTVFAYIYIFEAAFHQYGATAAQMRSYTLISLPFILLFTLGGSIFSGRTGSFKSVLLFCNIIILLTLIGL